MNATEKHERTRSLNRRKPMSEVRQGILRAVWKNRAVLRTEDPVALLRLVDAIEAELTGGKVS
jgi:hypothetical protein